jgi:hypothetical protein
LDIRPNARTLKSVGLDVDAPPFKCPLQSEDGTRRYIKIHRHKRTLSDRDDAPDHLSLP